MDDLTKSILEEVESMPDKEDYGYGKTAEVSGGDEANYASSFGIIVAICGALFIFGGQTFAIWTFGFEALVDDGGAMDMSFSADEMAVEYNEAMMEEDESIEYGDDDCNCDDIKDFFANLKLMFYALIGCGIAIALRGMGNLPAVAGITAVLSVAILAYTFTGLPEAWEDETEFFEMLDEDPTFYINEEKDLDGVDIHIRAMPYVGFFLPVVSLMLSGYLVIYNKD